MNCRKSDCIGDVLVAQRKGVTVSADHTLGRDPLHEVQKRVGNTLFRRVLTERRLHFPRLNSSASVAAR
jgi:hypothetical protein